MSTLFICPVEILQNRIDKHSQKKSNRMKKNKYGQYFTKEVIASFMVDLIQHAHTCNVLEPSCGKGVFIKELYQKNFQNVVGYEIDQSLETQYSCIKYESFISSPLSEKYDVVIGNPPYIRWKNLEPELKNELGTNSLWNHYFNSLCDYLFIFILKSIEQLNEKGELIFICSEYWLNTTNSQSLRNYMCKNGYISEIYHFKEAPLFDNVNASLIIFRYVKSSEKQSFVSFYNYTGIGSPSIKDLNTKSCFESFTIPQFREGERWILATEDVQKGITILEKSCLNKQFSAYYKIGDFFDIANGMVSGLDKAFVITQEEKKQFSEIEKMSLIKVLKAKNLGQFRFDEFSEYIFIQNETLAVEDFAQKYPDFYIHFEKYKPELAKRYNYHKNIPYWEFVFPRSQHLFEQKVDKIFVPCKERISHKNFVRFCFAPKGFYPLQDVTCIVPNRNCKENIFYALAYLNTPRVFNWLKYNGIIKGYIMEFSEKPLSQIPYRKIDWTNPQEVEIHDCISSNVQKYLQNADSMYLQEINVLFNKLLYEK